jgi:hypothetical protein
MTVAQLRDWIDACNKMEIWTKYAKSRRGWKKGREAAQAELLLRAKREKH